MSPKTESEKPTQGKFPLYLNIRQKVVVGMTISILAIGFIGGLSYHYLLEIQRKQHFVEIADDLSNIILEMRRYEKNYLLYGSKEDLKENRQYIQRGLEVLSRIAPDLKDLQGGPQLSIIEDQLKNYEQLMAQMEATCKNIERQNCTQLQNQVRELGKNLVDLSQQLVRFERQRIFKIIGTLKKHLISSLLIFLSMGGLVVFFVGRKILEPLRTIEKTTFRIAQGDFSHLPVGHRRDETQRVMEAFNRMIGELEKRQDQLVQAKKLSSIGILASGIAHQLNNPLNNISTSCQILLEELEQADPQFLRKMLNNSEQEIQRARDIVKGLLEFSRAREFSLRPTALGQVVERSVRLVSSQVPSGIEITKDIPEDLIIDLDTQRMQEVFLNLLMNAVQAIDTDTGEIKITAGIDPTGKFAEIQVADTGNGIAENDLGRIFDPFFTTKDVGAGTGLGLSIVYGIIQQHQGFIWAESRLGEGTRFIFRLPLHNRAIEGMSPDGSS